MQIGTHYFSQTQLLTILKYKIYILISNSETAVANDAVAKTESWNSDINTTITDDSENNVKMILKVYSHVKNSFPAKGVFMHHHHCLLSVINTVSGMTVASNIILTVSIVEVCQNTL